MMLIDYRESDFMQEALKDVATKTMMETGDYCFFAFDGTSVGIENKELLGDLLGSLASGRLADQCMRLAQEFTIAILLIRGPTYINEHGNLERRQWVTRNGIRQLERVDTNWRYTDVMLALMSIWMTLGVLPFYVENEAQAAKTIIELYRWFQKPEHGKWILENRKRLPIISEEPVQEMVLRSIPGIGPELAKSLLDYFGTLKEVANADIIQLTSVPKIGKTKATSVWKVFNMERTLTIRED